LFLVEVVIKITAYGVKYFADAWNVFDFVVLFTVHFQILRTLRLASLLKLAPPSTPTTLITLLCDTFAHLRRSLLAPALLSTLIISIYAVGGLHLFAGTKKSNLNFGSFLQACITLVRVAAGAPWDDLMLEKDD
jgi:voltage-gated sodium channel